MITITRTVSIAPGKLAEAVAFSKEIAQFIQEKFDVKLEVSMPIGGNPNRISWLARYDSLGAWEAFHGKTLANKKYLELAAKGGEYFIGGSMTDSIWRNI